MKVEKRTSYDSLTDSGRLVIWKFINSFMEYTYLCRTKNPMYAMIRTPTINEVPSVYEKEEEKFTNTILLDFKW